MAVSQSGHCSNNTSRAITRRDRNTQQRIINSMVCRRRLNRIYRHRLCRCRRHSIATTITTRTISNRVEISLVVRRVAASSTTTIRSIIIRRPALSPILNRCTIKINFSAIIERSHRPQPLCKRKTANSVNSIAMRRISSSKISCHFSTANAAVVQQQQRRRKQRQRQKFRPLRRRMPNKRKLPANHSTKSRQASSNKIFSISTRTSSNATPRRPRINSHRPRRIVVSSNSHLQRPPGLSNSVVCTTTSTIT